MLRVIKKPDFSKKTVKLLPELVPATAWCSNLRSELSKERWDELRRFVYRRAWYRCEICGGKGEKHPVECHEVWEYDLKTGVQKLGGLVALCPACHECKHVGLAEVNGRIEAVIGHMGRVNGMDKKEVGVIIAEAARVWRERSERGWKLDLSHLETLDC